MIPAEEPPPPDGPDPWDDGEWDPDAYWDDAPRWRRIVTVELPEENQT